MLVRRIALRNIRSYNDGEETALEFPDGVVLLEGDIGSGKSTLLYALEFALFGFSDMKGGHLLSETADDGRVSVTFQAGGQEYTVQRRLRRKGGDVIQEDCHFKSKTESVRLSPSDMKERVVSLLGFNEPTHPRAESLVYRYAIFTPQERMKDIVTQDSEARLHVIRRVLGAQTYQAAAENSTLVEKKVGRQGYGLRKASEDLEDKKQTLKELAKGVKTLESEIPGLESTAAGTAETVRSLETQWGKLQEERVALDKVTARIPLLERSARDAKRKAEEAEQDIQDLQARLDRELLPAIAAFEAMTPPSHSLTAVEVRLSSARDAASQLMASKEAAEVEHLRVSDLASRGVCPVCGQSLPADLRHRSEHTKAEVVRLEVELSKAQATLEAISKEAASTHEWVDARKSNDKDLKEKQRAVRELERARKTLEDANGRIADDLAELKEAQAKAESMRGVTERLEAVQTRLRDARRSDKRAGEDLQSALTHMADLTQERDRLQIEVAKKETQSKEARRLGSYQTWLSDFFRPSVESIERQTLILAAARFNRHFQRFFSALVDEAEMVVRVREDFTPVFEREGFEQEFEALSGGERTSLALAYRFALNTVVGEDTLGPAELVILDEPTDGFSREQVYRMRGLLEALGSKQVILVSHERELESMADHVFKVEKRNGTSNITKA
jgi:exonuclease SbcC